MPDLFSAGGFSWAALQSAILNGAIARLGGDNMAAAGKSSAIVSWQGQWDNLFVIGGIPNYQGADAASFRFGNVGGGPVDAAANYWWRSLFVAAGSQLISENAGGAADTLIQLGEKTARPRVFAFHITNFPVRDKVMKAWNAIGTNGVATVGAAMLSLEGQWSNQVDSIHCMQMVTQVNNMGAGSNFSVFGLNSGVI